MIKKLTQEVINQIAAGEVIECPASVIKELVDNSIDAKPSRIEVKIKNGGISYIEVSDDGIGISEQDLPHTFEAHATSKIQNLNDLNSILSMGFRGEALSTIAAISNVKIVSKKKDSDYGYAIEGKGIEVSKPQKSPRDIGTTVIVENIFKEIPARLKYLRAESTEYRKILEILIPYFLIYPEIHFIFNHNNKQIYNLPKTKELSTRFTDVIKSDFTKEMLTLFFDGEGIKITGFVAQPKYNSAKTIHKYIFVNKRPIQDKGIIRAVLEGFSRYIPEDNKVPFLINLEIKPSLVDINVHPKKEEVRFMNPFRVYSAVEEAVKQTLKEYGNKSTTLEGSHLFHDKPREINYQKHSSHSVKSGLEFSKYLLSSKEVEKHKIVPTKLFKEPQQEFQYSFYQIFNKYILVQFESEIWIIDQHAASERISYEKIQNQFKKNSVEVQNLLIPIQIVLSKLEINFLKENKKVLTSFGFRINFNDEFLEIEEVSTLLIDTNFEQFFKDLISESDMAKNVKKFQEDIISTIACHSTIRSGQKLQVQEMNEILSELKKCENSTSCPHGRPIFWKLSEKEIDKNFYRI